MKGKAATLIPIALLLTGCLNNLDSSQNEEEQLKPDEVTVQTTNNQLADDYYRAVIINGRYQLGASASVDTNLNSPGNIRAFEEGLLQISKSIFPTDQYFLQEGQVIDAETMTSWISRESSTNPEGLNPALPERTEAELASQSSEESSQVEDESLPDESESSEASSQEQDEASIDHAQVLLDVDANPIYLAQIMEKNIMVETDEGFALGGIVIGLAMNSSYEYTDQEGVVYHKEISQGEMRERGKQYANMIVGRLRNTDQLSSVPIVIGIYRVAPEQDTVGGTYLLDGISREGNAITDWTEHNEYRVALPIINSNESAEQYTYFDQFSDQVEDFFPNLNGISGSAFYRDGSLTSLRIEVVSQFYQQTEITALTQHLVDVAQRTLPEGVHIVVEITSAAGSEAYIERSSSSSQYQTTIF